MIQLSVRNNNTNFIDYLQAETQSPFEKCISSPLKYYSNRASFDSVCSADDAEQSGDEIVRQLKVENYDLRQHVQLLEQQLVEKDQTIRLLQQQMVSLFCPVLPTMSLFVHCYLSHRPNIRQTFALTYPLLRT